MRFTDAGIRALKTKPERYEEFEDNGRGFGIRVAPTGRKTWFTLYRFDGKPRRLTHGPFPEIRLSEARRRHADALVKVEEGVDPGRVKVETRQLDREASTFSALL